MCWEVLTPESCADLIKVCREQSTHCNGGQSKDLVQEDSGEECYRCPVEYSCNLKINKC